MGLRNYYYLLIIVLCFNAASSTKGQIVFKELPQYELKTSDSVFFDLSRTREYISLDGEWNVYPADDKEKKKFSVEVPSIFQGEGELFFEKGFSLTAAQITNYRMRLFFLGLNYTADISLNNITIYRHSGGEFPFQVNLPRDILWADRENILTVNLFYKLDSENTIPVKQRFMFPQNFGGIIKDVYLHLIPNISISDISISYNFDPKFDKADININSRIENREFKNVTDSLIHADHFELKISLISPDKVSSQNLPEYSFDLSRNKEKNILESITVSSPYLWSPTNPQSYLLRVELWQGDYFLDAAYRSLAIYSLTVNKDSIILNGKEFILEGVAYIPSFENSGSLGSYEQMEKDIRIIKETGFTCVRFSKSVPHPYYLTLCEKYGLFAFIELPINYIPSDLARDQNFNVRSRNFLTAFLRAYKKYASVAAIGLGSSYLPETESHIALIKKLAALSKKEIKALTYASFLNNKLSPIENLDLYGLEYFNKSVADDSIQFKNLQNEIGKGKVIISEAVYVVNRGNADGYVTPHSFEANAKFYEDLLEFSDENHVAGYFINSMFDYRGDYTSLVSGYSKDNLYQIGISGEDRNLNRLSYKVIYSKLHNREKVTIPIGTKKDDAPMVFIIFGLALALIMGVLVNSGRKFREDSTRALLRPYNFYADVRDQRIMSGYHSTILALISAAISALLLSNLLFYFREDIVLERLLISFGSPQLINIISYLAWHPFLSLFWLTCGSLATLLFLTIIVKIASFFVRNKVYLSNVYFSVIWSFLPLVLLIPVGIILYRLLNANVANTYIYLGLALFTLWIFYRLMKGIYVIFDVNPGSVYFYSILIVLLVIGSILIYYEIVNSAIDYLQLTIRNYNLLG